MGISRALAALLTGLSTFLLLAPTASAAPPSVPLPSPGRVVVTSDEVCPGGRADDLLVCGMRTMGTPQLEIVRLVGRCLVQRRRNEAKAVLADGYDPGDRAALREIARWGSGCVPVGDLHVSGQLLAGGMAEALLGQLRRHRQLGRLVALDPARPPVAAHDEAEMMCLCAVRAAPDEVSRIFTAESGSRAEEKAIQALLPQLGECLGRDIRLVTNRPALRAMLALAALRLALANQAPAGRG